MIRERESTATSTPRERRSSRFSGLPAEAKMRAPQLCAICSAAKPTPPAPAWIRTVSPARRRATSRRPYHAVRNGSGRVAASSKLSEAGFGIENLLQVVTWEPIAPGANAITASPGRNRVTPSPTSATIPAQSVPSVESPPDTGSVPRVECTARSS